MGRRRRAIVVGVEGGIGRSIARALAVDGCDLGLTWFRDEDEAKGTAAELRTLGAAIHLAYLDLAASDTAADVVADLGARLGGLDVLVGSAGHNAPAKPDGEFVALRQTVEINLIGMAAVLLAGSSMLIDQDTGGRIVVVTSVHEHIPLYGSLGYTAAKHGLGGLVKGLALELAAHGVTVNSVAPGPITKKLAGEEGVGEYPPPYSFVPMGRYGTPSEVAAVVQFLTSAEASFITGSSYGVDGGLALINGGRGVVQRGVAQRGVAQRAISKLKRTRDKYLTAAPRAEISESGSSRDDRPQ
jgi:NAD(P)-dependent dehydrogenase (short-subunit alcohol dehydrogenase family)